MKRILLVSDTHGDINNFEKVLRSESCDAVLHMGDTGRQEDVIRYLCESRPGGAVPVDFVAGNCDLFSDESINLVLSFEGVSVFMTHGHGHGVRHGLSHENAPFELAMLTAEAKKFGAQAALFGHTHQPFIDYVNGILCVNPGSLYRPRQAGGAPSYGILTVADRPAAGEDTPASRINADICFLN